MPKTVPSGHTGFLFILSPTCPHCSKTVPKWQAIEKQAGTSPVTWLSVADGNREFATEKGIADEVLTLTPTGVAALKAFVVPQTIYLRNGTIERIAIGELSDTDIQVFSAMK